MSIKRFLRLILIVIIYAKEVLPFSLSLLSGIVYFASHFKTGSGASKAIIKRVSYDSLYLPICL